MSCDYSRQIYPRDRRVPCLEHDHMCHSHSDFKKSHMLILTLIIVVAVESGTVTDRVDVCACCGIVVDEYIVFFDGRTFSRQQDAMET